MSLAAAVRVLTEHKDGPVGAECNPLLAAVLLLRPAQSAPRVSSKQDDKLKSLSLGLDSHMDLLSSITRPAGVNTRGVRATGIVLPSRDGTGPFIVCSFRPGLGMISASSTLAAMAL